MQVAVQTHTCPQIHHEIALVVGHPIARHVSVEELTQVIHHVGLRLLPLIHDEPIGRQGLALPSQVGTDVEATPLPIEHRLHGVLLTVFQILAVVRLRALRQEVGVGLFLRLTGDMIHVDGVGIDITQHIVQLALLIERPRTRGGEIHTIDLRPPYVGELRPDTDALATLQRTHQFRQGVDVGEGGLVEEAEAELDHILIAGIEAGHIHKTLHRAELITLLQTQLGVVALLRLQLAVGIGTHTADVFQDELLGDGGIAITLSKGGTQEAILTQLIIQAGSEDGFEGYLHAEELRLRLPIVLIHPVILEAHARREVQAVEQLVVVLGEKRHIVAGVRAGHLRLRMDALIGATHGELCLIEFLAELVIQIIRIGMVEHTGCLLLLWLRRIHQPCPQIVLIGEGTMLHHPREEVDVIGRGCRGEDLLAERYRLIHQATQMAIHHVG